MAKALALLAADDVFTFGDRYAGITGVATYENPSLPKTIISSPTLINGGAEPLPAPTIVQTADLPKTETRPFIESPTIIEAPTTWADGTPVIQPTELPYKPYLGSPIIEPATMVGTPPPASVVEPAGAGGSDPYNTSPYPYNPSLPPTVNGGQSSGVINSTANLNTGGNPLGSGPAATTSTTTEQPRDNTKVLQFIAVVILVLILAEIMR